MGNLYYAVVGFPEEIAEQGAVAAAKDRDKLRVTVDGLAASANAERERAKSLARAGDAVGARSALARVANLDARRRHLEAVFTKIDHVSAVVEHAAAVALARKTLQRAVADLQEVVPEDRDVVEASTEVGTFETLVQRVGLVGDVLPAAEAPEVADVDAAYADLLSQLALESAGDREGPRRELA